MRGSVAFRTWQDLRDQATPKLAASKRITILGARDRSPNVRSEVRLVLGHVHRSSYVIETELFYLVFFRIRIDLIAIESWTVRVLGLLDAGVRRRNDQGCGGAASQSAGESGRRTIDRLDPSPSPIEPAISPVNLYLFKSGLCTTSLSRLPSSASSRG